MKTVLTLECRGKYPKNAEEVHVQFGIDFFLIGTQQETNMFVVGENYEVTITPAGLPASVTLPELKADADNMVLNSVAQGLMNGPAARE